MHDSKIFNDNRIAVDADAVMLHVPLHVHSRHQGRQVPRWIKLRVDPALLGLVRVADAMIDSAIVILSAVVVIDIDVNGHAADPEVLKTRSDRFVFRTAMLLVMFHRQMSDDAVSRDLIENIQPFDSSCNHGVVGAVFAALFDCRNLGGSMLDADDVAQVDPGGRGSRKSAGGRDRCGRLRV